MEKWMGKIGVVTGANNGSGYEILMSLYNNGIVAIGLDLQIDNILKLSEINANVHGFVCDITDDFTVETTFKNIEEQIGCIDILVNNAGISSTCSILNYNEPMSNLSRVIEVNFAGIVRCTRQAFKSMDKRNDPGYIININSITGHEIPFVPGLNLSIYPSTKYAVTAVTKLIRHELCEMKNKQIRVTSLSPALIKTNFMQNAGYSKEDYEKVYSEHLWLLPSDVAETIIYLLSTPQRINIAELTMYPTGSMI